MTTLFWVLLGVSSLLLIVSTILFVATLGLRWSIRKELSEWASEFFDVLQHLGASDANLSEIEDMLQANSREVSILKEHHNITINEIQVGFNELHNKVLSMIGPEKADQLRYKQ